MKRAAYSAQQRMLLARLVEARRSLDLTQTDVAQRLAITQAEVSKFERGDRGMDFLQLRRWVVVGLQLPFEWFVELVESDLQSEDLLVHHQSQSSLGDR